MDSHKLKKWQIVQMHEALRPAAQYLARMLERMDRTRFPHDDLLRKRATDAQTAMQHLCMELHYLSCDSGVGRLAREPEKPDS